jgi:hypothetical protein
VLAPVSLLLVLLLVLTDGRTDGRKPEPESSSVEHSPAWIPCPVTCTVLHLLSAPNLVFVGVVVWWDREQHLTVKSAAHLYNDDDDDDDDDESPFRS